MKKRKPKTAGLTFEREKYPEYRFIVGLDEAGRGAWAGDVVVGAVALPLDWSDETLTLELAGVRDSKEMTALSRKRLVTKIKEVALAWGIGTSNSQQIDSMGINPATKLALQSAITDLLARFPNFKPDYLLTDGLLKGDLGFPYQSITGGDKLSLSIAAASVLAKTWRDEMMVKLDEAHPNYRFGQHKGYGTKLHQQVIKAHGVLPIHRRCYRPIKEASGNTDSPHLQN